MASSSSSSSGAPPTAAEDISEKLTSAMSASLQEKANDIFEQMSSCYESMEDKLMTKCVEMIKAELTTLKQEIQEDMRGVIEIMQEERTNTRDFFVCEFCPQMFEYKEELFAHKRVHKSSNIEQSVSVSPRSYSSNNSSSDIGLLVPSPVQQNRNFPGLSLPVGGYYNNGGTIGSTSLQSFHSVPITPISPINPTISYPTSCPRLSPSYNVNEPSYKSLMLNTHSAVTYNQNFPKQPNMGQNYDENSMKNYYDNKCFKCSKCQQLFSDFDKLKMHDQIYHSKLTESSLTWSHVEKKYVSSIETEYDSNPQLSSPQNMYSSDKPCIYDVLEKRMKKSEGSVSQPFGYAGYQYQRPQQQQQQPQQQKSPQMSTPGGGMKENKGQYDCD